MWIYRNVSVLLESGDDGELELDISYQVTHANWDPSYDIRVSTGENGKDLMRVS